MMEALYPCGQWVFILVMELFYPSDFRHKSKVSFPLEEPPPHSRLPFLPQNPTSPGNWWHFKLHNGLLQARGFLGDTSSSGGKACPGPWVSASPDPQLSPNSAAVPEPLGLLHLPGAAVREEALLRSCCYFRKEEGLEPLRHTGGDVHSIQLPDFPAQPSLGFRVQNLP